MLAYLTKNLFPESKESYQYVTRTGGYHNVIPFLGEGGQILLGVYVTH